MINNLPAYANEYKYIVARRIDGELWFWGAWNDRNKAKRYRKELEELNERKAYLEKWLAEYEAKEEA